MSAADDAAGFSSETAARYIDTAHATRARYQNLPDDIAPKALVDAYAAQEVR